MKITMKHLKRLWDSARLARIRNGIFHVCSDGVLSKKSDDLHFVDAVWSENHDATVQLRNATENAKHIFVSEICDVAVEEYATVCRLLRVQKIVLVGLKREQKFFKVSERMLSVIPNVDIEVMKV